MGDGNQAQEVRATYSADGVHLLRTTQQIQYQLSQMADQKASMLLAITFVIFTISVGQAKLGQPQPALVILGATAFVAAFLAVMAVLPSVKPGPRPDSIRNILFFGSFTQLPEDEYVARLLDIVGDTRTVYEAFAHDIYQNGTVLAHKKYKLIGYAYRVMVVGLSLSFLAFIGPPALKLVGL
ncbi:MAG TPA: Pycsar system effector family protein [Phenylobacterium sp.]